MGTDKPCRGTVNARRGLKTLSGGLMKLAGGLARFFAPDNPETRWICGENEIVPVPISIQHIEKKPGIAPGLYF